MGIQVEPDRRAGEGRWLRRVTLSGLRSTVRRRTYKRIWALSTVAYVVVSLFIGQMVVLIPPAPGTSQIPTQVQWLGPGEVQNAYLAPALLVVSPYVVVALPFWGTLVMVLLGLGIGLSVASTVAVFVEQRRRQAEVAASGVAPAVTGWAFLGACCCTTCAAQVAATGVVGAAVGSTPSELLAQSWPLAVLQLGVVALSLLYLEYRIENPVGAVDRPSAGRLSAAIATRVLLLVAAITWLFALVTEAADGAPFTSGVAYHWVVEHGALSFLALGSALAPVATGRILGRSTPLSLLARALVVVGAVSWGIWVPAPLVSAGLGGFVNEILGYAAAPAWLAPVAPAAPLGAAIFFHWGFQHLLLAGWGLVVGVWPARTLSALAAGEGRGTTTPSSRSTPAPVAVVELESRSD